ncbi:TRAP transporter small permease [Anaerobium acetethylicum]|uniref:TRAP-type C4-dicarboxylate transport system, small permease component n=1 Tax=Anaerobium acetethylicum TaxID=1619234 RepID=A0A1D3TU84_9FIRM|nr:TRAP transporter small permease [Anaerobium acetethylicum]SCP97598.1 TRAP-type C4-dicarboxylate transport system, small permease component [Anaerobium acetethylicum]
MESIKRIIDKILAWVCIFLLAAMTVLVTYQVVVRYFFNSPNSYTEIVSKYMFVWMIMYGSAYVFGLREHMNIAFVRDKMPAKARIIVEMIGELIIALFTAIVLIYGGYTQMIDQMVQLDATLQIPMGIIYSAVPVSSIFILFYFIYTEKKLFNELTSNSMEGRI